MNDELETMFNFIQNLKDSLLDGADVAVFSRDNGIELQAERGGFTCAVGFEQSAFTNPKVVNEAIAEFISNANTHFARHQVTESIFKVAKNENKR